jgi:hypothetical protein
VGDEHPLDTPYYLDALRLIVEENVALVRVIEGVKYPEGRQIDYSLMADASG